MSGILLVPIVRLPNCPEEGLPEYATPGASGMDLRSAIETVLEPGGRSLIPCGIRIALPAGFEAQVRPRSGLAVRSGVTVLNAPGTIDSDFRGEIKVALVNLGKAPVALGRGERIAQMVIARVERVRWEPCGEVDDTARGEGGFGHTGKS